MSNSFFRKPGRLTLLLALIVLLFVAAILASLSVPRAAPGRAGQIALGSVTPTTTPTPPTRRHLGPTPTLMPAMRQRRLTRTPAPTQLVATPTELPPSVTPMAGGSVTCSETSGLVLDEMWQSRVSGSEERYLIYLPPCYNTQVSRRYPTIYLLHGINSDDTFWEGLGVFEKMDEGLRAGKFAPAIIVSVDGNYELFLDTNGGPGSYEAQIVQELVPLIEQLYRTDARRTMHAIGGISRGGVWSLEIGFRNPDLFGIVAGHSPCLHYNQSPVTLDPLRMTFYLSLNRQRIWLDAGDEDGCLPDTEDMHAGLDSVGVSHEYNIWPGLHEAQYWSAHLDDYLASYTKYWPVR
jgi:enterochelin esterase-like enzyme